MISWRVKKKLCQPRSHHQDVWMTRQQYHWLSSLLAPASVCSAPPSDSLDLTLLDWGEWSGEVECCWLGRQYHCSDWGHSPRSRRLENTLEASSLDFTFNFISSCSCLKTKKLFSSLSYSLDSLMMDLWAFNESRKWWRLNWHKKYSLWYYTWIYYYLKYNDIKGSNFNFWLCFIYCYYVQSAECSVQLYFICAASLTNTTIS